MSDDKMQLASSSTIQPTTIDELRWLAESANKSGFLGTNSADQALLVMMAGRDLGFSYTQSLRAFHVIKGKPSLSADAAVAVCTSRKDLCTYFRCIDMTETSVTWETKRVDHPEPTRQTFTIEEAQRAGLVNDMYKKWPKRMLSSRCKMFLARDTYPELLMGLLDVDEAESITARMQPPTVRIVDQRRPVEHGGQVPSKATLQQPITDAVEEPLDFVEEEVTDDETGELVPIGDYMGNRITRAKSKDELKVIGKEVHALGEKISDSRRKWLGELWSSRNNELKVPA